jgi:hypothetical protein
MRFFFLALGFAMVATVGTTAAADEAGPNAPAQGPAAAPQAPAPLVVVLYSDDATVTAEAMRAQLAKDAGMPTVAPTDPAAERARGTVTVAYRPSRGELAVTFDGKKSTVSRVVAAPKPADAVRVAAALAANLVRNEAEDLLGKGQAPGVAPEPPATSAPKDPAPLPAAPVVPPSERRDAGAEAPLHPTAGASVFYPLATNYGEPDRDMHVQFNLFHGLAGNIEGLQTGLVNVARGRVRGLQMGHLVVFGVNVAEKQLDGVQIGVANASGGAATGAQIGAAFNWSDGPFVGLRVGGFNSGDGSRGFSSSLVANHSGKHSEGLMLAVGGNMVLERADGLHAALAFNFARKGFRGLAATWGANVSQGPLEGAEIGALNLAGDAEGAQVGLVNIAKKVKGAQVGLVNIADDVDGLPLGVVSVTKTGGVHPTTWASTASLVNIGVRFRTRYTFTMVSASMHPTEGHWVVGPGFTVGGRVPLGDKPYFETDLGLTYLNGGALCCTRSDGRYPDYFQTRLRTTLGYQFLPHLSAYAGVGGLLLTKIVDPRTEAKFSVGPEVFGGVEF